MASPRIGSTQAFRRDAPLADFGGTTATTDFKPAWADARRKAEAYLNQPAMAPEDMMGMMHGLNQQQDDAAFNLALGSASTMQSLQQGLERAKKGAPSSGSAFLSGLPGLIGGATNLYSGFAAR